MYKHRAKVVRCQYVYRFFHVYCTIKERAISFNCHAVMVRAVMVGALYCCGDVKRARCRWWAFVRGCVKFEGVLRESSVFLSTLCNSASVRVTGHDGVRA